MPYIKKERRKKAKVNPETLGELNYAITKMIIRYMRHQSTQFSYDKVATVTGVLENVKQEFYRRMASPYEVENIVENGDVY